MAEHPHLLLQRADVSLPRRRTGFGRVRTINPQRHGSRLGRALQELITSDAARARPTQIDPALILRIQLNPSSTISEEDWDRAGLTLLSIDANKTFVLFASDRELVEFRRRLSEYRGGAVAERRNAPYAGMFAAIQEIRAIDPEDRIGRILRAQGLTTQESFTDDERYTVDVELWDFGAREITRARVEQVRALIAANDGRVTDSYLGEALALLRAHCPGRLIKLLLSIETVANVDAPPRSALGVATVLALGLPDLAPVLPPRPDAAPVTILDSGVTAAHPLLAPAVGEATAIPRAIGDAFDEHGHGTMVAGLALYGDIDDSIDRRIFAPQLRVFSARVLNRDGRFDDEKLITSQMREAIQYFYNTYACRVFNISLGDDRLPYLGGKVSPWAAILDSLARELNIVIVVSAGNYVHDPAVPDHHVTEFPHYLFTADARVIEPATGCTVLTVGALAQRADVPPGYAANNVAFRPIAAAGEPSPFTRSGFGLGGAIKPDLCDFGGNYAYDGTLGRLHSGVAELSVVSLHREYLARLFTTDCGTSYAAPRIAHAAARLTERFPGASGNLIRALLAASARVPSPAERLLTPISDTAVLRVCGYGRPSLERAQWSDDNRVVLYADTTIDLDRFHVYEVPVPQEFYGSNVARTLSVTLAFDPVVRHTRFDYLGMTMSFRLIRGRSIDQIIDAFRARTRDEDAPDRLSSTRYDCDMTPGPNLRESSTLQKGTYRLVRPADGYGDTYHLVVRCERKWARDEHAPQRYAVVVVMEQSENLNLYTRLRERTQIRVAARV